MKVKLWLAAICFPVLSFGQGVHFAEDSTWPQLQAKAASENKYILVDVYASWCAPCKLMDRKIYTNDTVAAYINAHFVSIKLQADTTATDGGVVRSQYLLAHQVITENKVDAFPTLLVFSAAGKLVHKVVGFQDTKAILDFTADAIYPQKQYYTLRSAYMDNSIEPSALPYLAKKAGEMGEGKLAESVAAKYKSLFLDKADDTTLMKNENLQFFEVFSYLFLPEGSKGAYFRLLTSGHVISVNPAVAQNFMKQVIVKEEILVPLANSSSATQSSWDSIQANIRNKYGVAKATTYLPPAQLNYFEANHRWPEYVALVDRLLHIYPAKKEGHAFGIIIDMPLTATTGDAWGLNWVAWTVFDGTADKNLLGRALDWVNLAIKIQPLDNVQYLDTKANLLYKLGRVKEAINVEQQAVAEDNAAARKLGQVQGGFAREYLATIEKMKKGMPTWKVRPAS